MKDFGKVLDRLDGCKELECDGMTRLIAGMFQRAGIEHTFMIGSVLDTETGKRITPHFWIDLADGRKIDYRLRMWLGQDERIPHGVVTDTDSSIQYWQESAKNLASRDIVVAGVLADIAGVNFTKMVQELREL